LFDYLSELVGKINLHFCAVSSQIETTRSKVALAIAKTLTRKTFMTVIKRTTRKALLMQWGTRNSGVCLKAQ